MKIEQNKPHSIHLRLNEKQFAFIADLAHTADISISDILRSMVNTLMVATEKMEKLVDETNAKLGEPHADNQSNFKRIV